jgi:serralysin
MREDPITGVNASKFNVIAALYSSGAINQDQGIRQIIALADASTSVATLAYQFFTGKIPSAGGIDFLVAPTGPNPNNLNSAYYQSFSLENRYINFAVNLGKLGEGKDAFAASYGSKTLAEATSDAYTKIFGSTPTAAKVSALLDPSFVLNGQTLTRAEYFAFYGQDGLSGIGTKAAMVGWLLGEAVKADIGTYAKSNDAFLLDLADGATFAVDLVGTYGKPEFAFTG